MSNKKRETLRALVSCLEKVERKKKASKLASQTEWVANHKKGEARVVVQTCELTKNQYY